MGNTVSTDRPECVGSHTAFPSLPWPPEEAGGTCSSGIYTLYDSWRFTLLWTLILYAIFHIGAAAIAISVQLGKRRLNFRYMWAVPIVYAVIAGAEAIVAGSIVGVLIGTLYFNGKFHMTTWIPFIWGWINVLVLTVSSFTIQGGL
ncbi:hypothetical protein BX600DRAFT_508836 [Xylariales sp. PMI_506]|nr:hypothetical protein BX600DRAFT_508836 [Xylariales sp. PMI_506]